MRLTKKEFMEGLQKYQEMMQKNEEVVSVLGVKSDFYSDNFVETYYEFFRKMCDVTFDEDEITYENDLDYFVYDLEFGAKWHPDCCYVQDKPYRLQTIEDVWNALNENYVFEEDLKNE